MKFNKTDFTLENKYLQRHKILGVRSLIAIKTNRVVPPKSITEIPLNYFQDSIIKELILQDTIQRLGIRSFIGAKIDRLVLPKYITEIPEFCFECSIIKELILFDTIQMLGIHAFKNATIDRLEMSKGVTEIPEFCFRGSTIKELILSDTIEKLYTGAFMHASIHRLEIPEGVTAIPEYCFQNATIKELILPGNIKTFAISAIHQAKIDFLYIKDVKDKINFKLVEFKGMIFTENKAKFIDAGIKKDQVVDLKKRKDCFLAFMNKSLNEIHKLQDDFSLKILEEDFYKFERFCDVKVDKILFYIRDYISNRSLKEVNELKMCVIKNSKRKIAGSMFNSDSNYSSSTNKEKINHPSNKK